MSASKKQRENVERSHNVSRGHAETSRQTLRRREWKHLLKLQTAHRKVRRSNQPLLTSLSSRRPATPIALC